MFFAFHKAVAGEHEEECHADESALGAEQFEEDAVAEVVGAHVEGVVVEGHDDGTEYLEVVAKAFGDL